MPYAPHILGIDDGPFSKSEDTRVTLVGVMTEGATLVEGVSVNSFPIDGSQATDFYMEWIHSMKWFPSLQAVMIGGITVAGLGIINIRQLSAALSLPVLSVTRSPTTDDDLINALTSAGLEDRIPTVERTPSSQEIDEGLHLTHAGTSLNKAQKLLNASLQKALVPEPVRIAHLIATAVTTGESKGNV